MGSLFVFTSADWIDNSKSDNTNTQLKQQTSRIFMIKTLLYSVKNLHRESNTQAAKDTPIRLANKYLKRAKRNKSIQKVNSFGKRNQLAVV